MKIAGCRCLVIGGSRRLGRALAVGLAAAGADIAVSSRQDGGAAATVAEILTTGRRGVAVRADVATRADAEHAVAAARHGLGGLDAVVYAASGPFSPVRAEDLSEDAWDASMNAIARGFLLVAQAAFRSFVSSAQSAPAADSWPWVDNRTTAGGRSAPGDPPERGAIIAITDLLEGPVWSGLTAHYAAKAAQIELVRLLATAWAPTGVRVCGVGPAAVELPDDEHREATERAALRAPGGRLIAPAEVVMAVRRCIEDSTCSGSNILVTGEPLDS